MFSLQDIIYVDSRKESTKLLSESIIFIIQQQKLENKLIRISFALKHTQLGIKRHLRLIYWKLLLNKIKWGYAMFFYSKS